ncbi:MAG: DEAD/DEAH box helicase [Desulfitobacteriaceae bacterium]
MAGNINCFRGGMIVHGGIFSSLKYFQLEVIKKNIVLLEKALVNGTTFEERRVTVSPTGSGKTLMMSAIIQYGLTAFNNSCFVWITHNKQLTKQISESLHVALEPYMCTVNAIESGAISNARVVLLNVQKGLSKKANVWLKDWVQRQNKESRICIFIVDESDEGQSGLNMGSLRKILQPKLELGFTASFKPEMEDNLYIRVPYVDVVRAEMIVDNIYYEVSPEIALSQMLKAAIDKRNRIESLTNILRGTDRYFVPKMVIQTQASRAEEIRSLLVELLSLSPDEAFSQVKIHTQDDRGLDGTVDMNELRFVIGDLMIERGWNMPEVYVLFVAKQALSVTKGVQLLGRVLRLPQCKRFEEEELQPLNAGYVYIAGKHTIQKSCEEFMSQGLVPKSGGRFGIETETIYRRTDIYLPEIETTTGELLEPIWSDELNDIVDKVLEAIFEDLKDTSTDSPTIRTGKVDLEGMALTPLSIKKIEAEWNYEHTKDILRSALFYHFHQGFCERIIGEFHAEVLSRNLRISEISGKLREAATSIRKSLFFRRLSLRVKLKRLPFQWPDSINVVKDKSYAFSRCIFPKISGLNSDELDFATILNTVCEKKGWYWFRNTPSDILVVKSGYPDFVVFSDKGFLFIEYKGTHLVNTPESVLKNALGSMAGTSNYYMVFKKDNSSNNYYVVGVTTSDVELFKPEMHLGIYLE